MIITSVHIQHYKSLTDIHIPDMTPITVLVGSNAVGKSNIIDALRFLRDAVTDGLDHAISSRGGIGAIRQYSPRKPYHITIKIEFTQTHLNVDRSGSYELKVASLERGNYRVEKEESHWFDSSKVAIREEKGKVTIIERNATGKVHRFTRDSKGEVKLNGKALPKRVPEDQLTFTASYLLGYLLGVAYPVVSIFKLLRFSSLYPNTLRNPARPDTDKQLKETGDNWASILKALRQTDKGKQAVSRILELMKVVVPSIRDVNVKAVGGYLVPQFLVRDTENAKGHFFDPIQLSDGTLRIFSILLALYQIPNPRFLALEEPELTIHPGILTVLAEAFEEVSATTQLLITSHSPYLVDHFHPEQIRVVSMIGGETKISKIKKTQVESIKEHLTSLQELMMSEGLQPEKST